jgi:hypothetical protein
MSVVFKAENEEVLKAAFLTLNWPYRKVGNKVKLDNDIMLDLEAEQATLTGSSSRLSVIQDRLNLLKRTYSMESIKKVAGRNWSVKMSKSAKDAGVLMRRN